MLDRIGFLEALELKDNIDELIDRLSERNIDVQNNKAVESAYCLFDRLIISNFTEKQSDYIFQNIFEFDRQDYESIYEEAIELEENEKVFS